MLDITPTIQFDSTPVTRESSQPFIDHALWLLHGWRPSELDVCALEARYLVAQLSLMLLERDEGRRADREALQAAVGLLHSERSSVDERPVSRCA